MVSTVNGKLIEVKCHTWHYGGHDLRALPKPSGSHRPGLHAVLQPGAVSAGVVAALRRLGSGRLSCGIHRAAFAHTAVRCRRAARAAHSNPIRQLILVLKLHPRS
ncbi:hypothetical protein ANCCAN_15711 [Ancylostoma caninum]|uniref:Uncharacterized protein n=1 Tax=Ancylostoma caninum TaxID=29170 RepID=A0A368G5Y0_ANCCA|nr:hypothetical protein ANCCAN_15711 [Ancylostoma caninum]